MIVISLLLSSAFGVIISDAGGQDTEDFAEVLLNTSDMDVSSMYQGDGSLEFIENRDQLSREDIRFFSRGPHSIGFTDGSVIHGLRDEKRGMFSFEILFSGCNYVVPAASDPTETRYNFFIGKDESRWSSNLRGYHIITYNDLWDGIDMAFYSVNGNLKYDLIVHPGANTDDIRFEVIGSNPRISDNGISMIFQTPFGDVKDGELLAYQENGEVGVNFQMIESDVFTFDIDEFDEGSILVIDPLVSHCTYFGGSDYDDNDGRIEMFEDDIILGGSTYSSDFPTTNGVIDSSLGGILDCFISRIDPTLSNLKFSTFIGGSEFEIFGGLDVDGSGNVYITGYTTSKDYPVTSGVINETSKIWTETDEWGWEIDHTDAFLTKISSDGTSLLLSTFITGKYDEYGVDVVVDSNGNSYITGETDSKDMKMVRSYDDSLTGAQDIYIMKLNPTATEILYSTYIGGDDIWEGDYVDYIELDDSGRVTICGNTETWDFPTTTNAYRTSFGNSWSEGFLLQLESTGSSLRFSTFLYEECRTNQFLFDEDSIWVTGTTSSTSLPVTEDAYKKDHTGWDMDFFLMELDSSCSSLLYCTYVGGSNDEYQSSIDMDDEGRILLAGSTYSGELETTPGAPFSSHQGEYDTYIVRFESDMSDADLLSYFGGSKLEWTYAIFSLDVNNLMVIGNTQSNDLPVTPGSLDTTMSDSDFYLARIKINSYIPLPPMNISIERGDETLVLNWDPPLHDGNETVMNYTIYMSSFNQTFDEITTLDASITSYTHEYLENGDTYYYYITASNIVGESFRSSIIMEIPARPPSIPLIQSIETGDCSVTLFWEDPEDLGGDLDISFSIYSGTDSMNMELIESGIDDFSFTHTNLKNGVRYFYSISASNVMGEGDLTPPMPAIPMKTPSEVVNLSFTRGSGYIHLHWEKPSDDGGSELLGYEVSMKEKWTTDPFEIIVSNIHSTEYNVTKLTNGVTYDFRILSRNEKGSGPESEIISSVPLGIPSSPMELDLDISDEKASLEWKSPSDMGGADTVTYSVYMGESDSDLEPVAEGLEDTLFRISKLKNGVEYQFAVTASNDIYESLPSSIVKGIPIGPPGVPTGLKVEMGNGRASLTWDSPDHMGGDIFVGYKVFKGPAEDDMSEETEVTAPFFSFTDLVNGKDYVFGVKAYNSYGTGPMSDLVSGTPITTPGVPTILFHENRNGSIYITWSRPDDDGGSDHLSYNIHVRSDEGSLYTFAENVNSTSFTLTGLDLGIKQWIGITAIGVGGEGFISDMIDVIPAGIPVVPFEILVEEMKSAINISWVVPEDTGGSEITDILLFRSENEGDMELVVSLPSDRTFYLDRYVDDGTDYSYMVKGRTDQGTTPPSNVITASPKTDKGSGIEISFIIIPVAVILVIAVIILLIFGLRDRGRSQKMPAQDPSTLQYDPQYLQDQNVNAQYLAPNSQLQGLNDPVYDQNLPPAEGYASPVLQDASAAEFMPGQGPS